MKFRPSSSYAIIAVLLLGLVGLGTREDRGDGYVHGSVLPVQQVAVSHGLDRADGDRANGVDTESHPRTSSEPDPATTYALELDAVLEVSEMRGAVASTGHDRPMGPAGVPERLARPEPPDPVAAAAAGLGLSTSPNVEMWRAEVSRYPWPVDEALRVMQCESGGNPLARGDGGVSLGLFQINTGWRGPSGPNGWASWAGIERDDLLDGPTNIRVAFDIWTHSGGWGPWTCKP